MSKETLLITAAVSLQILQTLGYMVEPSSMQKIHQMLLFTHDQVQIYKDWLKAPDCSTNFIAAANKKTTGTGMWIIEHPKYVEWDNNGGLLWIQGKAGSGKTVIL
ncbi:hypothetical protein BT96DRAFT_356378 [Gymnopus androsaceus JB14]|uniref:Nephrocystin 3-like N-terminal domain-containing protein n=1 Tax=Gymnopus androsaceus JB14 TaxID=1447944 RepID=A0A6A4GXB9_9AGAR|nr:hypothetical protein BT96DRAFT_356378 [Gymnopus androsaceus JB14]